MGHDIASITAAALGKVVSGVAEDAAQSVKQGKPGPTSEKVAHYVVAGADEALKEVLKHSSKPDTAPANPLSGANQSASNLATVVGRKIDELQNEALKLLQSYNPNDQVLGKAKLKQAEMLLSAVNNAVAQSGGHGTTHGVSDADQGLPSGDGRTSRMNGLGLTPDAIRLIGEKIDELQRQAAKHVQSEDPVEQKKGADNLRDAESLLKILADVAAEPFDHRVMQKIY